MWWESYPLLGDAGPMETMMETVQRVGRMLIHLRHPLLVEAEAPGRLLHKDGTSGQLSGGKARRVRYWMGLVPHSLSQFQGLSTKAR